MDNRSHQLTDPGIHSKYNPQKTRLQYNPNGRADKPYTKKGVKLFPY